MRRGLLATLAGLTLALSSGVAASPADAATQIIVTPTHTQGWTTADTSDGGTVEFVADPSAPGFPNQGALELTTPLTPTTAHAQYLHAANTPLADVGELSYYTRQISPPGPVADPSYQLVTYLLGGTAGFTTLVFEPYQGGLGPVVNNVWQSWDVDQGRFWSTRTVTCSNGTIIGTPGGPAVYTLAAISAMCPDARVAAFGVNIGSNNPGYVVRTDLVDFNGVVYNFEPDTKPGCSGSTGQGGFYDRGNHHGDFKFHTCKNGHDNSEDSFSSTDRGDGSDFQSSSISSAVIDQGANTITITGIGSSTGGLPMAFTLVALATSATTPGWVSMTFADGYMTAGDLVSGAITIE
jgi:hypothetical protein